MFFHKLQPTLEDVLDVQLDVLLLLSLKYYTGYSLNHLVYPRKIVVIKNAQNIIILQLLKNILQYLSKDQDGQHFLCLLVFVFIWLLMQYLILQYQRKSEIKWNM